MTKPDYSWLAGVLLSRIEQLKRYPPSARIERLEGKVIVRAIVQEGGQLVDVEIAKSSGYDLLDSAALELMRQASPLHLPHALGKPQVTLHIPISYKLDR